MLGSLGARADVLGSLDGALSVLESSRNAQTSLFDDLEPSRVAAEPDMLAGRDLTTMPIDEIWQLAVSEGASRRTLERIAIERFAVPKGSMRSFASVPMLREKLMTLIRNDATHRTISHVSRISASD